MTMARKLALALCSLSLVGCATAPVGMMSKLAPAKVDAGQAAPAKGTSTQSPVARVSPDYLAAHLGKGVTVPGFDRRHVQSGTAYYVSTTGDDSAGDGSKTNPWRTITFGSSNLQPGDILLVAGGEYDEDAVIACNGTGANPIQIYPQAGTGTPLIYSTSPVAALTISGIGLIVKGFDVHNRSTDGHGAGILVTGNGTVTTGTTIAECEVDGAPGTGIVVTGEWTYLFGDDVLNNGNSLYPVDDQGDGIRVQASRTYVSACAIAGNKVSGIRADGPTAMSGLNIYKNYLYANGTNTSNGIGLQFANNVTGAYAWSNVIAGNRREGVLINGNAQNVNVSYNAVVANQNAGLRLYSTASSPTVFKNAVSRNVGEQLDYYPTPQTNSDQNILFNGTGTYVANNFLATAYFSVAAFSAASGTDANSTAQDPQFYNVPTFGFDVSQIWCYDFHTTLIPELQP